MKRVPEYLQLKDGTEAETAMQMVMAYYGAYPAASEIQDACDRLRPLGTQAMVTGVLRAFGFEV